MTRLLSLLWLVPASVAMAQSPPPRPAQLRLQRLLVAEDARGTGDAGIAPIVDGLTDVDLIMRRVAVRAAGRLQRPELGPLLLPLLNDPQPAVRSEAANAIAQSLTGVPRGTPSTEATRLSASSAATALMTALEKESSPVVVEAFSEALGRLAFTDSSHARLAEAAIRQRVIGIPSLGVVHAFYTFALARRFAGRLSPEGIAMLRRTAVGAPDPARRRLAVLAAGLVGGLDSSTTVRALGDRDEQVRRLALAGVRILPRNARIGSVSRALRDASPIVRVAGIGAQRALNPTPDCGPLVALARDPHPYVALIAVDSLGAPCTDSRQVALALAKMVDRTRTGLPNHAWQLPGRALRSLTRVDSAAARMRLGRYLTSPRWEERVIAAEVATRLGDPVPLRTLIADPDQNVQEASVTGLSTLTKHIDDARFIVALASPGYQVVLAAAQALAGSTDAGTLAAVLDAFDRLSAERRENARDPRVALLKRIEELGSATTVERLTAYRSDFDTTIAMRAAAILSRWTGSTVTASPTPLPRVEEPLADLFATKGLRLRVTLSPATGGGSFVIAMYPDEAPASVARLVRLARAHFYDGHLFQRVEPNFVVQGGGPGASEYIGDQQFMRDELTARTHARGTIGISARGRDTGDAQLFVNLVDNPRLDHEYTVVGTIIAGRDVAERVLEGDVIASVDVVVPR